MKLNSHRILTASLVLVLAGLSLQPEGHAQRRRQREIGPFTGVTADGAVVEGLFPVAKTGVSTEPVREAAFEFLESLTDEQRRRTRFAADAIEWRRWSNTHSYRRQGVSFKEMTEAQKEAAWALIAAGMSIRGVDKASNIMMLNGHLAELTGKPDEYGEGLYWLTVMGEPSLTEPWGWQLDGHHLVVNFFVLGDQVVMTPTFMGSEPVSAETGRFRGASIMRPEQEKGLALMRSLSETQRVRATLPEEKKRGNNRAEAFNDNLVLPYAGIRATELTPEQRSQLLLLIAEYVDNIRPDHAHIRMDEIRAHLEDTYFGWIGGVGDDAVFYYRIHSPVVLIEFDHQGPIALGGPRQVPTRRHVHSVVRTPNGNDYGKDLLRQHYEATRDNPAHGHVREW